ncbi:flagellar hook-length control protein FliK [Paenibacillus sp. UNC451MF]|uniref:flagellar hook-length control protein FliK n=1 Tax=Paenibacillus sp. UNC451MF TaxID=1449063 RepID=UPI00048B0549|nr:flagellar hook-length control protein FliK [Paenibacillus sp. UNC451MF]
MEIQAQMPANVTSSSSSSAGANTAGAGLSNSTSGQASGGFSAALVGMLTGTPSGEGTTAQALLPGLNALIQQLGNTTTDGAQQQTAVPEDALKQLDALMELLDSNSEDAAALLQNPDVQAWLAQIQAMLLSQQTQPQAVANQVSDGSDDSAASLLLEPSTESTDASKNAAAAQTLFVPLDTEVVLEQQPVVAIEQVLKPVSKQEAKDILKDLKQLLESGKDHASLQTKSSAQSLEHIITGLKNIVNSQNVLVQPTQDNQLQQTTAAPAVNANLEYLAAKAGPLKVEVPLVSNDGPLFEPLVDLTEAASDSPAVPMHEFLKQVSNGTHVAKTPVLLMQAPTFTEDMSQFVMKSFTVNAIAEGITEAKLSLYPQHLGHVDVKLTMHNGQLIAQFVAENMIGKEMLESQMSQLRATLQNQGIQVDKLEVTQSPSLQSGLFQEQRQQQQQFAKQQKNNNTNKAVSLEEELEQETKAAQILSGMGRTSIDVTA